ncbi:hypothetical protein JCM5353_007362 [Sporobolomyces roseus]
MSTSTSPLGDCVVCGTKTATRCSGCARHGTDWMYFCSQEHQKLVWKVHKFVCGPRSNPFSYPGYSQKEIDDYIRPAEGPTVRAALDQTLPFLGGFAGLKNQLQNLKDPGLDQHLSTTESLKFAGRRAKMHDLQVRYELSQGGSLPEFWKRLAVKYPFNIFAWVIERSPIPELSKDPAYVSWSTQFQHKFLFSTFLLNSARIDPTRLILEAAEYTLEEMKRFVREVVAVTHPNEAKLWLEWMTEAL